MSKYVIDSTTLVSIGDAVREKEGTTEPILVSDLATRISAIETGGGGGGDLPEEAFTITGNCSYRFASNGWNWFIERYGNKIKTENLTTCLSMFSESNNLTSIPFDLNAGNSTNLILKNAFYACSKLESLPKIIGRVQDTSMMIYSCNMLRELKEEVIEGIDWSYIDSMTSSFAGDRGYPFSNCFSLRKYPNSFLAHGNPVSYYSYAIYGYTFQSCYTLDEIVDLPIQHRKATWTSNAFRSTFDNCCRLKRLTFETNEDGSSIKIDGWSKQTIDLSKFVGRSSNYMSITGYNSGITEATQVKDDATYQALKDNPDWWTLHLYYSRYNHDSAVETINTLPDLSGGAGGNTIKFTGESGALTDGGAINTLTEEEIAVAAAKGWTVTLV